MLPLTTEKNNLKKYLKMLTSNSHLYSFAQFFLVNQFIGGNNDKELSPEDLRHAYNNHMSLGSKVSDADMTADSSDLGDVLLPSLLGVDSKIVYKGLTKLTKEVGLIPIHGKKKIKNTTTLKKRKGPGFPSVWKLPEQFKQLQNIRESEGAIKILERCMKTPEMSELTCSYYKCLMTTNLDAIRSVDESFLNRLYASVPVKDKDNPKPSMEEFTNVWTKIRHYLLGLTENEIEVFAERLAIGIVSTSKVRGYMIGLLSKF